MYARRNYFQAKGHLLLARCIHTWKKVSSEEERSDQEVVDHDLLTKQQPTTMVLARRAHWGTKNPSGDHMGKLSQPRINPAWAG
jgi:hypothetical protein